MHAVAEMLAAIVVAVAATAVSWFGVDLQSDEPRAERSVRRIPIVTSTVSVPRRSDRDAAIPC